jgi:hypothetical protein
MKAKKSVSKDQAQQFERFKAMAREVEADESPDALDRAFARLDTKRKLPAKRKSKAKI